MVSSPLGELRVLADPARLFEMTPLVRRLLRESDS
jgi:hypothetical protein